MSREDEVDFERALRLYDSGKAEAASPLLTKLADRYVKSATVQSAAGMSLLESGHLADGVTYLTQAEKLRPGDLAVAKNLGVAYVRLGDATKAVPLLRRVTDVHPRDVDAWLALAQAYRALKQLAGAAKAYEHAASLLAPQEPNAMPNLLYDWAATLLEGGHAKDALVVLQRIPGEHVDAAVLGLRAEAEEKSGLYEQSVGDFRRAAELQPNEQNLAAYGEELLRHWTFAPAASIFEYGSKLFPKSLRLQRDLGIAYYGSNDYSHSSEVFGALLMREPDNNSTADLLGRSCSALGTQSTPACDQLRGFALAHPNNASAALYAATVLLMQPASNEGYEQVARLLNSAIKADPSLAAGWYERGVLQQAKNDWAGSAGSLEKAISLRPAYPEAHYRLSRAYAHLGKTEEARLQMSLQHESADAIKREETRRLEGVLTFLTESK